MTDLLTIDEATSAKEIVRAQTVGRTFVYFIRCAGHIKIGYTGSFVSRFVKMLTDMPPGMHIIHAEDGTRATEQILHREFAELRVRGEWFRVDARIYEHIRQRRVVLGMPEFVQPATERAP